MRDSVELLEMIGRDAALRHASPDVLGRALEAANASIGLRQLAVRGDIERADKRELDIGERFGEHMTQTGAFDEDTLFN
jgi:hypothetical protein